MGRREERVVNRATAQVASERITVGLIPRTVSELEELQALSGMSKTDIVNRAISFYAFVEERLRAGQEVVLRNPQTGEYERVHLL